MENFLSVASDRSQGNRATQEQEILRLRCGGQCRFTSFSGVRWCNSKKQVRGEGSSAAKVGGTFHVIKFINKNKISERYGVVFI